MRHKTRKRTVGNGFRDVGVWRPAFLSGGGSTASGGSGSGGGYAGY
jgi:hypothetical protein